MASEGIQGKQAKEDLKNAAFICVVCARFFRFHDEFCLHVDKYCNPRCKTKESVPVNNSAKEPPYDNDIALELQETLNSLYQLQSSSSHANDPVAKTKCDPSKNYTLYDIDNVVQDYLYVKTEPVEYLQHKNDGVTETMFNSQGSDENYDLSNVKKEPMNKADKFFETSHVKNESNPQISAADFCHTDSEQNYDPSESLPHEQSSSDKAKLKRSKLTIADVLYVCDTCGKAFRQKSVLQAHFVVHSEETPYSCSECGKAFKRKKGLQQHELTHVDKSKLAVQPPKRRRILSAGERKHNCFRCGKAFKTMYELKRHVKRHSEERPFQCADCCKAFKNKQDLTRHVLTHINAKPHTCDECGRSFISRSKLKRHQLSHSDVRAHICSVCSRGFKLKSVLEAHLLTHVKDKTFHCLVCKKSFRSRQGLLHHNESHTLNGNTAYSCDLCGKIFKDKKVARKHKYRHNSHQKPESCDSCGKTFKFPSGLYVHALGNAKNKCGKAFKKRFGVKGQLLKDANKISSNAKI